MEDVKKLYATWLESLSSENTRKKYSGSVSLVSKMVFGKDVQELTEKEFIDVRYSDVIGKLITPLKNKGVKDSTIKAHLAAMRSLLKMLGREKLFTTVDINELRNSVFTVDSLSNRDVQHHEAISLQDLQRMEQWLVKKDYLKDDGKRGCRYAMLIDFMFKTAVRATATFKIRWSDFTVQTSPYGGDWAMLTVIDKGKKLNTKYLPLEYYKKIKSLFFEGRKYDLVFGQLSQTTLRKYFKEYSDFVGRNIVIHSLKAGAATTLYSQTKDLLMVRDFCDHESVKTTEAYIHVQKDPNQSGTAILAADYDYKELDGLSKEQLLMLIHSKPELEHSVFSTGISHKVLVK